MGRWHAHYLVACGSEVTAIVDPDERARRALQARHPRARQFPEVGACLAACDLDAVHVCAPPASHLSIVTSVLEHGQHALVEKPLGQTAAEAGKLVRLAAARDMLLNPVHQFPFQRGFRGLNERLDRLGDLVELSFVTSSAGGAGRVAADRRVLLYEILPHPLSLFRAALGEGIAEVEWQVVTRTDDDLDLAGEREGVLLRIRISLRGRPTRNVLTIVGGEATAHVDLFHGFSIVERGAPSRSTKVVQPFAYGERLLIAAGVNLVRRSLRAEFAYPGLRELIGAFHAAVRAGAPGPIAPEEIIQIAEAVDRIRGAPERAAC